MNICTHYPDLSVVCTSSDLLQYVVVTKKDPAIDPIAGPICNLRLIITSAINRNALTSGIFQEHRS